MWSENGLSILLFWRLGIGLGQGLLLWLLVDAAQTHSWPATEPYIFVPLFVTAVFIPIAALAGLGNLQPLKLALWLGCASVLIVVIELHQVWRDHKSGVGLAAFESGGAIAATLALALGLFIAHVLVMAGGADRKPIAAYPTYFDIAWKHQLRLLLSLAFLGAFWGVLLLGAELFRLIGVTQLRELVVRPWFAMPASTLVFTCAVHVTDIRSGLVQGMRDLLHGLLSWLLPVATVLIVAFITTLPFTGLAPLWRTSHGSEIVLAAATVLVVLINAVYRDGGEAAQPAVLRWVGSAAVLCLPVLVAISAYGLAVRIEHRGWTEYRVVGAACLIVAGCVAVGYAWAAVASRPWLKCLEATNIVAAGVVLLAIVALTTPIADPARLSVGNQVARLEAGRVSPAEFDFNYLRFRATRYGREALERLRTAEGPNAEAIRQRAERALTLSTPSAMVEAPTADELAGMTVFPPGQKLPQSLAQQDWSAYPHRRSLPRCLLNSTAKCEAFVTEVDGNVVIIVVELTGEKRGVPLQQGVDGEWRPIGAMSNEMRCENVRQALRAGDYHWVASRQMELEIAGQQVTITRPWKAVTCP